MRGKVIPCIWLVQNEFSWAFCGSKIFSQGYFMGPKFFLMGISQDQNFFSWVSSGSKAFSHGYFMGPKFFLVGVLDMYLVDNSVAQMPFH